MGKRSRKSKGAKKQLKQHQRKRLNALVRKIRRRHWTLHGIDYESLSANKTIEQRLMLAEEIIELNTVRINPGDPPEKILPRYTKRRREKNTRRGSVWTLSGGLPSLKKRG